MLHVGFYSLQPAIFKYPIKEKSTYSEYMINNVSQTSPIEREKNEKVDEKSQDSIGIFCYHTMEPKCCH